MKAIIQHNFTSGLGDFISDTSHYMTILENVKKLGYEIHLRISLARNKYVNGSFFSRIFDDETLSFFDSIKEIDETIYDVNYEGCQYYGSNHGPHKPGQHHFDIFFDVIPENFAFSLYDAQRVHLLNQIPKIIPKPRTKILEKVESFWNQLPDEYSFLHIRTSDIIDSDKTRYNRIISKVEDYIKETNIFFHLGTNNKYIYEELSKNPNIYIYHFKNYDVVNNDMNAFTKGFMTTHIDSEILLERMEEIFSEMISITKASSVFYAYDIDWVSNFLFYPLAVKNNKIPLVNKNEWRN